MERDRAWRIGNGRRYEAREILARCGIEAWPLCALKMAGKGCEPVGEENIVDVVIPREHVAPDEAILAIFDEDGQPKACSAKVMTVTDAERLRLRVEREAAPASDPHCYVKGVDGHGSVDA